MKLNADKNSLPGGTESRHSSSSIKFTAAILVLAVAVIWGNLVLNPSDDAPPPRGRTASFTGGSGSRPLNLQSNRPPFDGREIHRRFHHFPASWGTNYLRRTNFTARLSPPLVGSPGLWGTIYYTPITIERPDAFVPATLTQSEHATWHFAPFSAEKLLNVFERITFADGARAFLCNTNNWQPIPGGFQINPPRELVLGLSPPVRRDLYVLLGENPLNAFHAQPFTHPLGDAKGWFYKSGLSTNTLTLVNSLVYQSGPALCFADLPDALALIPTANERRRLLKTLSQHSTMLMRLRIRPDTNMEDLTRYWAAPGLAKDVKPLLESLSKVEGNGAMLDIVHLLPPFARKRLYTFPYPAEDALASKRDCVWTAMNFFNDPPDDRFCDFNFSLKALAEDYYPVQDKMTYGDIVLLVTESKTILHAAVYIADDVVFTKNGAHFNQPWVLMRIPDLLSVYPLKTLRVGAYRSKRT